MTRWQIFSALALRRLPDIVPKKDIIEAKCQHIFDLSELARSRLSDHEMQHLEDHKPTDSADLVVAKETAQDREDAWNREKSAFEFAPYDERFAKAQHLFFKYRIFEGGNEAWRFPQASYDPDKDQTLADTARRAMRELFDVNGGYTIISTIPSSVFTCTYDDTLSKKTGFDGAKVFFIKANIENPPASVLRALDTTKNDKLKWLTKQESFGVDQMGRKYLRKFYTGILLERRLDVEKVLGSAARQTCAIKTQKLQSVNS